MPIKCANYKSFISTKITIEKIKNDGRTAGFPAGMENNKNSAKENQ